MNKGYRENPMLGTANGFKKDIEEVITHWGVKCLMRKHFKELDVDTEKYMKASVGDGYIEYSEVTRRSRKNTVTSWECYYINSNSRTLLWKQERNGRERWNDPVNYTLVPVW